ncbi:aminotransferase class V-fold PLP-dependent enzyme [Bacillus horti]|uniref:cysteine desulfurase n=1 Tax=Caldalkalibacillus horti TaxID=77523 RepID=A0ABT9W2Q1_9BACI|nr:aminotransferase class V-fold PLP-dependent enzyme [Bacillus horti]MDQ0167115.1 cysteine desulfurase family protein [Bacillus horti]
MIYFDHAASSWPKPEGVAEAVAQAINEYAANPGRGGHQLARQANAKIRETRALLAQFFNIQDPRNLIFCSNATHALNQAIQGIVWEAGDRVISTSYEHNSVRRPLEYIREEYGVEVDYIQVQDNGSLSLEELESSLDENTKLIAVTHVSNVTGAILPLAEISVIARKKNIPLLVDASQSAGFVPLDVDELGISLLAFPGHKGLYGPQGTGALYIAPDLNLTPLLHGGTGSHSELKEQPGERPARYESGTLNTPGIAGLGAGVKFLLERGMETIFKEEQELTIYALTQLSEVQGVQIYGPGLGEERAPVIAFNIEGIASQELAHILDQHYSIATRAGLHCSPLGHESIKTEQIGAVRISFGLFNTKQEVDQLIVALNEIRDGMLGFV